MRIPYTHKKTSECGAGEEEEEGPITQYIQRETSKEKEKREEEKYMFRRWVCVCTCGEGGRGRISQAWNRHIVLEYQHYIRHVL